MNSPKEDAFCDCVPPFNTASIFVYLIPNVKGPFIIDISPV